MKKALAFILASTLTLTACTENAATGTTQFNALSADQERELGQQSAQTELVRYGQYQPSSQTSQYVKTLCQRIWDTTEDRSQPVSCLFMDSDIFNAWATPGYINVYRGLMPYMGSEAQLASVLAHESGHVTARHVGQAQSTQMVLSGLATIGALAVGLSTQNADTANIAYAAAGFAGGAALMAYGRGHELQADELGQRYMARAGYNPEASVAMLENMARHSEYEKMLVSLLSGQQQTENLLGTLFASHPNDATRRQRAQETLAKAPSFTPANAADEDGIKSFHNAINGLAYGPKTRYGIAGRGYLAIPKLRFALTLADGFILRYQEAEKMTAEGTGDPLGTWRGAHPASGTRLTVKVLKAPNGMNTAYSLQEIYPNLVAIQPLMVAGQQGASGIAASTANRAEQHLVIGIPLPANDALMVVTYTFPSAQALNHEQETLKQVTAASKFLNDTQAKALKPLHIATHSATASLPISLLADDLPQGAWREEWFRLLNSIPPGVTHVEPGQWYKTVVDTNVI